MLLTLGVSHKTAPIDIRERLAFANDHIPLALTSLRTKVALDEVALLSTCNRTEFYCSVFKPSAIEPIMTWWQECHAPVFNLQPYIYQHSDEQAVKHIMRVACGLDSMVIGEPQILGQLKSAFRLASQVGVVGKKLSRLFQTSFNVAKRVRTNTLIARHPVSIAFAAVTLARQIFSDLSKTHVVLVGAGENSELVLRHLMVKQLKNVTIVNRTFAHAAQLATRYQAKAAPFSELLGCLAQADIVISSIACSSPLITEKDLHQALAGSKRRPLLMIDLGVPRNIEPTIAHHEDVYLYSVDDLQGIVTQNLAERQQAMAAAEILIAVASNQYMDWVHAEKQIELIRKLRLQAENIKQRSVQLALSQLAKGRCPQEIVTELAHQLTQKLLHAPTRGIRELASENLDEKLTFTKELFTIE